MNASLTTTTTAVTSFAVANHDVHRILTNAVLATSKDTTMPMLCAVHLELEAGTLLAVGTDRYRIHTDTCDVLDDGEQTCTALVLRADVLAVVKASKDTGSCVVTISDGSIVFAFASTTMTFGLLDATFPSWRKIMPAEKTECLAGGLVGVNPTYLADMAKVIPTSSDYRSSRSRVATPLVLQRDSEVTVLRMTIGETFVGLVMPIRLAA